MKRRIQEILEDIAFDEPTGCRDFTRLQVELRINESDIDKAIERMLEEYEPIELIERMLEIGIRSPEVLELASDFREELPVDFLMMFSL